MNDTNGMPEDFVSWVVSGNGYILAGTRWDGRIVQSHLLAWQAATERATQVERERCAAVCQTMKTVSGTDDVKRGWNAALRGVAAAIRQNGAECQGAIYVTFDDSDTSRKRRAPLPSKPHKGVV